MVANKTWGQGRIQDYALVGTRNVQKKTRRAPGPQNVTKRDIYTEKKRCLRRQGHLHQTKPQAWKQWGLSFESISFKAQCGHGQVAIDDGLEVVKRRLPRGLVKSCRVTQILSEWLAAAGAKDTYSTKSINRWQIVSMYQRWFLFEGSSWFLTGELLQLRVLTVCKPGRGPSHSRETPVEDLRSPLITQLHHSEAAQYLIFLTRLIKKNPSGGLLRYH